MSYVEMHERSRLRGMIGLLVFMVVLRILPLAAQSQAAGSMHVRISSSDQLPEQLPVMVSALRGGEIVHQREFMVMGGAATDRLTDLPAGTYDVRVEGEGVRTEVKRGMRVFAGREAPVQVVLQTGTGLHVVEYATGGLAREEVATRLNRLESFAKHTVKWFGTDSTHGPIPQF